MKLNALTSLILLVLSLNANAQGLLSNLPELPVAKADTTVQMKAASAGEPVQFKAPNAGSSQKWTLGEEEGPQPQKATDNKAELMQLINSIAKEYGLPANLFVALINVKNPKWDVNYSDGDGQGLLVVTPRAAKAYGENPETLTDPAVNIRVAAKVLKAGVEKHGTNVTRVVEYYQCGKSSCSNTVQTIIAEVKRLGI